MTDEVPRSGSEMSAAQHWRAWLDRYGDDYATDDERRAAYQDFQTNLATMQAVFSQSDDLHTAGYLAAHERIADDLKAFRKRGGRIEVLGNTPLRSANNASPFRSSPELRKPPTPVTRARKA